MIRLSDTSVNLMAELSIRHVLEANGVGECIANHPMRSSLLTINRMPHTFSQRHDGSTCGHQISGHWIGDRCSSISPDVVSVKLLSLIGLVSGSVKIRTKQSEHDRL